MVKLNLETKNTEQERIKTYLESNASEILANKINNGVAIEKDGKQLINKKDLNGFSKYACEEARKQAKKGAMGAYIDDPTVYGWAIHYFEEDSIIGKLFNLDGTEYKPPAPAKTTTPIPTKPVVPPKPKEPNLFDMIAASEKQKEQPTPTVTIETPKNDEPSIDQIADSLQAAINEKHNVVQPKKDSIIEQYEQYERRHPDRIIVMRIGDFYEVLGQKAELAAKVLDLTLTGKRISDTERVPMCGFPYHAKDRYINKLRKSRAIVVIDGDDVQKLDTPAIEDLLDGDIEEDFDDLTEEEMRQFDGDIQEPAVVPKTVLSETQKDELKYVLTKDDIVCEPSVLQRLHEILGDILA